MRGNSHVMHKHTSIKLQTDTTGGNMHKYTSIKLQTDTTGSNMLILNRKNAGTSGSNFVHGTDVCLLTPQYLQFGGFSMG
jgi:hypothetical protein